MPRPGGKKETDSMNSKKITERYVAFLRGINVGGHHTIPMADLIKVLEKLDYENVVTILNSGNVIFDTIINNPEDLEKTISSKLESTFGFPVPTVVRKSKMIYQLFKEAPFHNVTVTKDIRLYVSFLKKNAKSDLELPWANSDNSYQIIGIKDKTILSILDVSVSKTPKAMGALEKSFGRDITTRN